MGVRVRIDDVVWLPTTFAGCSAVAHRSTEGLDGEVESDVLSPDAKDGWWANARGLASSSEQANKLSSGPRCVQYDLWSVAACAALRPLMSVPPYVSRFVSLFNRLFEECHLMLPCRP